MSYNPVEAISEHEANPFDNPRTGNPKLDFDKFDEIPIEASGRDCPKSISSWKDVEMNPIILANIESANYTKPTPIQKNSLPIVIKGRDLMGCAQTGSGKTAAFLIPIMVNMLKRGFPPSQYGRIAPMGLVLAPTRELAVQIYEEACKFGYRTGIRTRVVYGGTPVGAQLRELDRYGCDLLVATPGRLGDIIDRKSISMTEVRYVILDEADRMLDMGFEPQIRKIVEQSGMPPSGQRQTLMFSATFAKDIQKLAASFLYDYIFLAVGRVGATTDCVTQKFIFCEERDKHVNLTNLLRKSPPGLTLIFVETKKKATTLDWTLNREGFKSTSIHGDREQADRTAALKAFSNGTCPVLIATNVAARGLDIGNIQHVINFDMPANIDDYVHRIGRTGRAGKTGISTTLITPLNSGIAGKLADILRDAKQEVPKFLETMSYSHKESKAQMKKGGSKFGGKDFRLKEQGANGTYQHTYQPPPQHPYSMQPNNYYNNSTPSSYQSTANNYSAGYNNNMSGYSNPSNYTNPSTTSAYSNPSAYNSYQYPSASASASTSSSSTSSSSTSSSYPTSSYSAPYSGYSNSSYPSNYANGNGTGNGNHLSTPSSSSSTSSSSSSYPTNNYYSNGNGTTKPPLPPTTSTPSSNYYYQNGSSSYPTNSFTSSSSSSTPSSSTSAYSSIPSTTPPTTSTTAPSTSTPVVSNGSSDDSSRKRRYDDNHDDEERKKIRTDDRDRDGDRYSSSHHSSSSTRDRDSDRSRDRDSDRSRDSDRHRDSRDRDRYRDDHHRSSSSSSHHSSSSHSSSSSRDRDRSDRSSRDRDHYGSSSRDKDSRSH